jgi:hypothetical protein
MTASPPGPDGTGHAPTEPTPSPTPPELPRWAQRSPRGGNPLTEERLAAYIGAKWERVYRRKLAPFLEDPTFVPTWNWSAALVALMMPSAWFLYRKLYLPFAIFFLVPGLVLAMLTGSSAPANFAEIQKPENQWLVTMALATQFSAAIAAGGTANWFLFRRARAAAVFVSAQTLPPTDEAALMSRIGGVNRLATALFITMMLVLTVARIGA